MFILLRDYLKKLNQKSEEEIEEIEEMASDEENDESQDCSDDNLVEEEQGEQEEHKRQTRKEFKREQKKERKRQKKEAKRRKKKPLTIYSLILVLIFIVVFVSRICLLTTSEIYMLTGQITYSSKMDKYVINYDIEELWNDNHLLEGEETCTPPIFTKDSSAIRNSGEKCISGVVTYAGNKVKINYNLPKYVSYEELKLYISKDNFKKDINNIKIEIRRLNNRYQITEIIPLN